MDRLWAQERRCIHRLGSQIDWLIVLTPCAGHTYQLLDRQTNRSYEDTWWIVHWEFPRPYTVNGLPLESYGLLESPCSLVSALQPPGTSNLSTVLLRTHPLIWPSPLPSAPLNNTAIPTSVCYETVKPRPETKEVTSYEWDALQTVPRHYCNSPQTRPSAKPTQTQTEGMVRTSRQRPVVEPHETHLSHFWQI